MKKIIPFILWAFTHYAQASYVIPNVDGANAGTNTPADKIQAPYNQAVQTGTRTSLIETASNNILANANFESSTLISGWTSASGTNTIETTNVIQGKQSLKIVLSALTGTVLSQSQTPAAQYSGVNVEAGMWVKTDQSNVQVCALQAGSEVSCADAPFDSLWHYVFVTVAGPASGSSGVRLKTIGSVTGTIYVDMAYVGSSRNTPLPSTAGLWAKGVWTPTASCTWRNTNTGVMSSFSATAACPNPTITGYGSAAGTKIPGFVVTSLPAGDYIVQFAGNIEADGATSANFAYYRVTDGTETTTGGLCGGYNQGTGSSVGTGGCSFSLHVGADLTNATVQLQSTAGGTGGTPSAYIYEIDQGFEISIYRMPNAATTQQTFSVAQTNVLGSARWATTTGANSTLTTLDTWNSFSNANFATNRTNSGACTVDTASEISCKFSYLPAGKYKITGTGFMGTSNSTNATSMFCNIAWYDGTNRRGQQTSWTNLVSTGIAGSLTGGPVVGEFEYTTPQSNITFKLQGYPSGTGSQCFVDFANTAKTFEVTVEPVQIAAPMPLLTQSVISGSNLTGVTTINNIRSTSSTVSVSGVSDETMLVGSGGVLNLPKVSTYPGKKLHIVLTGGVGVATTAQINPNGSDSVCNKSGGASFILNGYSDAVTLQSDGISSWYGIDGSCMVTRVADITCSSSSVNNQVGNWISSVGNISSGSCAISFIGSLFADFICTATQDNSATNAFTIVKMSSVSSTAATITGVSMSTGSATLSAATSFNAHITCSGTR